MHVSVRDIMPTVLWTCGTFKRVLFSRGATVLKGNFTTYFLYTSMKLRNSLFNTFYPCFSQLYKFQMIIEFFYIFKMLFFFLMQSQQNIAEIKQDKIICSHTSTNTN